MKIHPAIYIIVGVVALIGALFASYLTLALGEVAGSLASMETMQGTDASTLQASATALSTMIMLMWVWIVSVIAASALCIYTGVRMIRKK